MSCGCVDADNPNLVWLLIDQEREGVAVGDAHDVASQFISVGDVRGEQQHGDGDGSDGHEGLLVGWWDNMPDVRPPSERTDARQANCTVLGKIGCCLKTQRRLRAATTRSTKTTPRSSRRKNISGRWLRRGPRALPKIVMSTL